MVVLVIRVVFVVVLMIVVFVRLTKTGAASGAGEYPRAWCQWLWCHGIVLPQVLPHGLHPHAGTPPPTVTPTLKPPELDHPSPIPKFHPLNPVLNPGTHTARGTYTGAQYTGVVYRRTTYTGVCTTLGHHDVRHTGGQYTDGQYVGAHHTTDGRDHHDRPHDGRCTFTLGRHQVHHPSHVLQQRHGEYPLHQGEHHRDELHSPNPTAVCAAVTAEPYTTSSWVQVPVRD